MASQLASLMAGGSDDPLTTDPNIMAIQPQLTLAQAMMRSGMDASPAYPMQAAARVFQSLAGMSMQRDAVSDLAHIMSGNVESLKPIFKEGTAVGDMLRSPNLSTQLMGVQLAPKVGTLMDEPVTLGPNDARLQGPNVKRSPVPSTEIGRLIKQAQDQEAAGDHAGAIATSQQIAKMNAQEGTAVPFAPQNLQNPPNKEPATPSAAAGGTRPPSEWTASPLQPPIEPNAAPAAPPPNVAMPSNAAQNPAQMPAAVAAAKGQAAAAEAAGRSPFEPGGTMVVNGNEVPISAATRAALRSNAPNAALGGKPLPNPAVEPQAHADTEELAADRKSAIQGQQDMAAIRTIQDFLPKVATGWSAETKLEGARILKQLGMGDDKVRDFLSTDVAAGQLLQKKFVELSAAAARSMGAREPGSVISMFAKAYPNLGTDAQAVRMQTNALYMDRLRQQQLAQQKTNYLNDSINGYRTSGDYRGLKGFNEQFNTSNPPERYLGAAEAMSGAPEVWRRTTSTPERNATIRLMPPGTRYLAPDAQWHVTPGQ